MVWLLLLAVFSDFVPFVRLFLNDFSNVFIVSFFVVAVNFASDMFAFVEWY